MPPALSPIAATALAAARDHANAGRLEPALLEARRAAEADAGAMEAFAIWGIAAAELGRFGEALEPLFAAQQGVPEGSVGWANVTSQLARCLANSGSWGEALRQCSALERLSPPDPMVRQRLGAALARMNLTDRGLPHLEWARARRPTDPHLLTELGLAYLSTGRMEEAESAYEAAIAVEPLMAQAHAALADLRRWTPQRNHIERLIATRADPRLTPQDWANLGFPLFKELDDLGRLDEAWAVLSEANEACRGEATNDWSVDHDAALVEALIETFSAAAGAAAAPPEGPRPIFIVGLPRSGTTLLERILAAHSQVEALGELPSFPLVFRSVSTAADRAQLTAETVRATADADWAAAGRRYMAEVAPLATGGANIIDKLPANSLLVGAIARALPNAAVVHMRRDPMDALFGAYKVRFANWYGWSCRQADMAEHYIQHERLMAHWRDTLGPAFIQVRYEDLVADPEAQTRQLLLALGLGFEPACLEPHKTQGAVRTASLVQVREPISKSRVGGWRRYEAQLSPLRQALEAAGVAFD